MMRQRALQLSLIGVLMFSLVACGTNQDGSGGNTGSEVDVLSGVESGTTEMSDSGMEIEISDENVSPGSASGSSGTGNDMNSSGYGDAPSGSTDSVSPVKGDALKFSDLKAPDGVDVDMKAVKQAVADAAFDKNLPDKVTVGKVTKKSQTTSAGNLQTLVWRYVFGEGDAIAAVEVTYRNADYLDRPDVTATIDDLRVESQNVKDKSNLIVKDDDKVDRVYPTVSLSGGSVNVGAVSKDMYAVSIDFVALGTKLDKEEVLPTLTINGITMKPEAVEGNITTHGGETRAAYRYHGDIPCKDDMVVVEWCGNTAKESVSASNMSAQVPFSSVTSSVQKKDGVYEDVSKGIAKSVSGRIGLCHMSAGEIRS